MTDGPSGPSYGAASTPTSSGYQPAPYGASYNNYGLVYGLRPAFAGQQHTGLSALNSGGDFIGPKFNFTTGGSSGGVEADRAVGWITGTLASQAQKSQYGGFISKFFPHGASFNQYQGLWQSAVQYASQVNHDDPHAKWSPWDALDHMWKQYKESGGSSGGGGAHGTSFTSTSVSLTGKDQSDMTLDNALSNLIGRTATDEEKKTFLATLNATERAHPSVTTGGSDANGNSHSSSVSTSTDPSAMAAKFGMSDSDFAEFQSATTYMDAMLASLGSPVKGR